MLRGGFGAARVVVRVDEVALPNGLWGGIMLRGEPSVEPEGEVRMVPEEERCYRLSPLNSKVGRSRKGCRH
jgi:hypothetical protein